MWPLLLVVNKVVARRNSAERLLASIRKYSGAPIGRIVHDCELSAGTAHYQLERLEQAGVIRTIVAGRRRLVFLASDAARMEMDPQAFALLQGTTALAVARILADEGPMSILGLVIRVGESPRAVYYHVKRLRDVGLVSSDALKRYRGLAATPKLRLLLARLETSV